MGTDINLYAEILTDSGWTPIPPPDRCEGGLHPESYEGEFDQLAVALPMGRPYNLFDALAGVRGRHIEPIAEPRGLPADLSPFYAQVLPDLSGDDDCFGHSWLLVREIIDYDWDGQFIALQTRVRTRWANLFDKDAGFPRDFPKSEMQYPVLPGNRPEPDTVVVSWRASYREYVGCSNEFIDRLKKLGPPDRVRIIFWFDA